MKFIVSTIICTALISAVACRAPQSGRLIKIGVSHGPNHSHTLALHHFAQLLQEKSGGKFRVRIYHGASLGDEKQMQELLTIGSAEIAVTGLLNIYEPLFAVLELPYLYRDREHIFSVMSGPVMEGISASLIPRGIRVIGFYENGFRHITSAKRPILTPADLKGLMIRTPENPAQIITFNTLGAIATPMPFSELYTALLQGVVDGQENPLQQIYNSRFYEVQNYCAKTSHIYNSAFIIVSERFWKTLAPEEQALIRECALLSSLRQLQQMEALDIDLEKKLRDAGITFTYPDQSLFQQACQPVYEAFYAKFGERARQLVAQIRATD